MSESTPVSGHEQKRETTPGTPTADRKDQTGGHTSAKNGLWGLNYQAGAQHLADWGLFSFGGALDKKRTPGAAKKEAGAAKQTAHEGAEAKTSQEGDGESELKQAVGEQAAKRKSTPDTGVVDAKAAFEKAKEWTLGLIDSTTDKHAEATYAKLSADHKTLADSWGDWVKADRPQPAKGRPPKDPGTQDAFIRSRWVSAYWFRRCYQFAAKVQSFLTGPKTAMTKLVHETGKAAKEGKADEITGRTIHYRGLTLAEVGAAELANPKLAPGASIHVKLHFEGDNPYEYKDDFHHWVVYVGDGKFSDTLTGQDKAGAAHDTVLQNWVKSGFKGKDFKAFHKDPRFVADPNATKVVPRGGLQPRVTAEYDPRMSVTRKEG